MGGIIYGFNRLCSKITSGVENTVDESMSDIHFWNTPTIDLLRSSYLFRKLGLLGTELKSVLFSRIGAVLYL